MPITLPYGNNLYPYTADDLKTLIDYSGGNNPIYIGKAVPGTAISAAKWQIRKLTYAGNLVTAISFASGTNVYTQVWDNRVALSYS